MTKSVICPLCAVYIHLHTPKNAKTCLYDAITFPRNLRNRNACQLIENRMRELEDIIKEIRGFIK